MLPDLPKEKARLLRTLQRALDDAVAQQAPLLAEVRVIVDHEGEGGSFQTRDTGRIVPVKMKRIKTQVSVPVTLSSMKREEALRRQLAEAAGSMAKDQTQMLFASVTEASDQVGNSVNAGGKPLDPALINEALSRLWIDFNEDGSPRLPTIVVSPEMAARIAEKLPEWERDPKVRAEQRAIIDKKREEWRAREANRKLVG